MDTINKSSAPFSTVNQVGVVVADLDKAMEYYKTLGIGPFIPPFRPPCNNVRQSGKPIELHIKVMFAQFNNIELELIQPIGDGFYMDFLKQTGGGINHLGFWVDDLDKTLNALEKKGVEAIQIGRRKEGGGFADLDTLKYCGIFFQIGQGPPITKTD